MRDSNSNPKLAGFAGIVGGILLAVTTVVHNAFAVEPGTLAGVVSGIAHAIAYALMLIALLGIHARYGPNYGRTGRGVVYVLGTALASLVVVFPLLTFVFGFEWEPGAVIAGIAFLTIHVLGVIYGVILRRTTEVSRIASGLLVAVLPAFLVMLAFELSGVVSLSPAAFEVPLALGFAALGYELLTS